MAFVASVPTAHELLAGPRGRRLCWEMLDVSVQFARPGAAALRRAAEHVADELSHGAVVASTRIFSALQCAVGEAMYWQPPDNDDQLLADIGLSVSLTPLAEALLNMPATHWWTSPLAEADQRFVQFLEGEEQAEQPTLSGIGERLRTWRTDEQGRNAHFRERPPAAEWSGRWWSTPNRWDVPVTSRDLAGCGPVGLSLVEDSLLWKRAACWSVLPAEPVRVYEINDAQAWAELVRRYPFEVTDSRQTVWEWTTGRVGRWLMPDWAAVAEDLDAVHLTVHGYLTTAGRAIEVDDAAALMAGWDPDATFWLTDVLRVNGPASHWAGEQGEDWQPVDP